MEEDIKILEGLIEDYRNCREIVCVKDIQAIENLIARNKELEGNILEDNIKEQKRLYNAGYRNGCNDTSKWNDKNYIPKSKIKEKIEELEKQNKIICIDGKSSGRTYKAEVRHKIIEVLQELLEENKNE